MLKVLSFALVAMPLSAATCNLPVGTGSYTLSASASAWSCGHVPTIADDARPALGIDLTVDSAWSVKSFVVTGGMYPAITLRSSNAGSITVTYGKNFQCDACDLRGLGNSSNRSIGCALVASVTCRLTNSTVDGSGLVDLSLSSSTDGNTVVQVNGNVFTNSTGTANLIVWGYSGTPKTSGVREIKGNVFDKRVIPSSLYDFTVEDNYFGQGCGPLGYTDSAGTTYSRNFIHLDTVSLNAGRNTNSAGTFRDHYILSDFHITSAATGGGGGHTFGILGTSNDIQRVILETSDRQNTDSTDSMFGDGTAGTVAWQYILALPDAVGESNGQLTSMSAQTLQTYSLQHATWWGGSAGEASIRWAESGPDPAHSEEIRSSIAWAPAGGIGTWYIGKDLTPFTGGTLVTDVCAPAMCDYNWTYGYTSTLAGHPELTNQGNGYIGKFSTTPGSHDQHGDPGYADYQRNAVLWDSRYLGNSYAAWSAGAIYNIGDQVTNTVNGSWWNLPVNYRRVVDSACAGNAVPPGTMNADGNPSGWRASDGGTGCWELASLYRIRQGVGARTTIYDGAIQCGYGCTYTEAVFHWVSRGFTPQNPLLRAAAHDGLDIGAVPMDSVVIVTPGVF